MLPMFFFCPTVIVMLTSQISTPIPVLLNSKTDLEVQADHPRGGVGNSDAITVDRRPASKKYRKQFKPTGSGLGCTLDGTVEVERAAGSIVVHVMNHDPARLVLMRGFLTSTKGEMRNGPKGVAGPNVTHEIHDFGFGPAVAGPVGQRRNSLAGSTFVAQEGAGIVKYSLKVVPISHQRMYGAEVNTHTYSANVAFASESSTMQAVSPSSILIGIEIAYEFTPIMVRYTDTRKSMFEFLTSVCAIVGGIYTVSGLLVRGLQGIASKKQD